MPLSQKQMEYLAIAWQCFDAEPKIDYEKFRAAAGLSSAASARELLRVTKKKLKDEYFELSGALQGANGGGGGGSTSPVKKGPRTPSTKRSGGSASAKKSHGLSDNEDDDNEMAEPRSAKRAKTPASTKKVNGIKKEPGVEKDAVTDDEDLLL